MSDISFVRHHSLPIAKAKRLVQQAADDLAAEYALSSEWHGDTLHFHRLGVDGLMSVTDSQIQLEVTLGLLLKKLRGRFAHYIERDLDRLLPKRKPHAPAKRPARKTAHSR